MIKSAFPALQYNNYPLLWNKGSKLESALFFGVVLYLSSIVFEGPIRQLLSYINAGTFLYARDLIVALVITVTCFAVVVKNGQVNCPLFISIYFLFLYFLLGLLLGGVSVFSGLFGLKIFSVALLGISLSYCLQSFHQLFYRLTFVFLFVTIFGVLLNYLLGKFPWEGQEFETAFGVTTTTREWWIDRGGRRLPGFTRASFDAAMIIGIGFAYIINTLKKSTALLIGSAALVSVYLTTSKGMLLALLLLLFWYLVFDGRTRNLFGKVLVSSLVFIMLSLPLVSCLYSFGFNDFDGVPRVFASFVDRIANTWPRSCSLITEPTNWVLGNGVGSIGVPLGYNPNAVNQSTADNLVVYLFVSGGVVWVIGLLFAIKNLVVLPSATPVFISEWQTRIYSLLIIILGYGVTTNMHEQPFYSVYAGLLIGLAWRGLCVPGKSMVDCRRQL